MLPVRPVLPFPQRKKGTPGRFLPYAGYLVVTMVYLFLRFYLFYNPKEDLLGTLQRENWWLNLWTLSQVYVLYLRLMILPLRLSADHPVPHPSSPLEPAALLSLGLILSLLLLTLLLSRTHRGSFYALLWFFIPLLPVSNLIPTSSPYVAERFLYLPSVGYCLILALGIVRLSATLQRAAPALLRGLPRFFFALLLLIYSVLTVQRNAVWKDDYTLFSDTVRKNPASALAHLNLGAALFERGRLQEAAARFQKVLELDPNDVTAHLNLARTFEALGRWDPARPHYREASRRVTDNALFHLDLGALYEAKGLYSEAIEEYEIALRIDPKLVQLRENIQSLRSQHHSR